jgi:enoyl-CoA hydratase
MADEFADCAVVLTATGSCFSAGLDFDTAWPILASRDLESMALWIRRYQATNLRIWTFPRPTVAAVNGHAFAGGLITALDCDYRIAAADARFSLNEVPIGIPMPAIYLEIIRYAIGGAAATVTSLFGREYDAPAALKLGLVHSIASQDQVEDDAIAMARAVPPESFEAYAFTKRALQADTLARINTVAARLDDELPVLMSSDAAVGVRAARYTEIKKQSPSWARFPAR